MQLLSPLVQLLPELTVHARDRDESEVAVPTRRRTRVAETRVAVATVPERVMLTLGGFCACVVIETEVDELRVSALTVRVKSHDADGESVPAGSSLQQLLVPKSQEVRRSSSVQQRG